MKREEQEKIFGWITDNVVKEFIEKTDKLYEFYNIELSFMEWVELTDYSKLEESKVKIKESKGGYVFLNKNYQNAVVTDITEVEIPFFYQNILCALSTETDFHYYKYNEILNNLLNIKGKSDGLINYLNKIYGVLKNKECEFNCLNTHLIENKAHNLLIEIKNEFLSNILYIDTNKIYFKNFDEIEKRFKYLFEKYQLLYNLNFNKIEIDYGIFLQKKKYILNQNKFTQIKGLTFYNGYKKI